MEIKERGGPNSGSLCEESCDFGYIVRLQNQRSFWQGVKDKGGDVLGLYKAYWGGSLRLHIRYTIGLL